MYDCTITPTRWSGSSLRFDTIAIFQTGYGCRGTLFPQELQRRRDCATLFLTKHRHIHLILITLQKIFGSLSYHNLSKAYDHEKMAS
jgi:hypothetical protein